jgi:type IV pilus assembly protein PilM
MATPRFAWGIDVGNRALKAVKLVRDGDSLRVDDFEVIEHETVLSNAGDNRETLIQNALASFAQRHPSKGGVASIGVAGQSSFARFIKLPPVEPKKIPEIVRFEAIQQIPFPLDDVEWSYQLFQSPESPDVEVGIFAMRKELINQHIGHFTSVDLNVQVVQMNPLAVYNAMQVDQRIDGTTMIIDLGAENTDLIIADESTIWLRSIPIGGNNFTEALVKAFKLNFPKAEDLKRNASTSKYARQIFQAMRPVFADLVAEVQRSIGFYASVHRDSRIKKILALGGTFKLPGLQKYLQQNLQLEVQRLDSIGAGSPTDPKVAASLNDNILSVVGAYGLALQAMGEGKITSSLLPQHIRREKIWKEKQKWFAAAAALFLVGTGIGYGRIALDNMSLQRNSAEKSSNEGILTQANGLESEWTTISGAGGPERQRILNIHSLEDYRDLVPSMLTDIHASVPAIKATPQEVKQKFPVRADRQQIFVEHVLTQFTPDLAPVLAGDLRQFVKVPGSSGSNPMQMMPGNQGMNGMGAFAAPPGGVTAPTPPPTEAAGAAPGAGGRGYVLTIHGTTPNKGGLAFVEQSLVKGLTAISQAAIPAGKPYYIAKAQVVSGVQMRNHPEKLAQLKTSYDAAVNAKNAGAFVGASGGAGGGFMSGEGISAPVAPPSDLGAVPGGVGAPGATGTAGQPVDDSKVYQDRVTGEDLRDDWEFTVVAVIVLDPPPKTATPAAAPTAAAN